MIEWIATPWKLHDQDVRLEMIVRKPVGNGPFPVVIFNHGSTGSGRNPRSFSKTVESAEVSAFFNDRGWMVMYPQRRGRGQSGGEYLEGMSPNRLGYSCDPTVSLAGFDRALEDLDLVMNHVLHRDDVIADAVVLAGASRGGALAVAMAGRRPLDTAGVINFSGGWLGRACADSYASVNESVFVRGAAFDRPMLWLQGRTDSYYGLAHCKSNFDSFRTAGGQAAFYALPAGHNLVSRPALWAELADAYLATLRIPT